MIDKDLARLIEIVIPLDEEEKDFEEYNSLLETVNGKCEKWDSYETCINSIRKHTKILCSNSELIGLAQKNFNFYEQEIKTLKEELINENKEYVKLNDVMLNLKATIQKIEVWRLKHNRQFAYGVDDELKKILSEAKK